jgi:hypothetical protein
MIISTQFFVAIRVDYRIALRTLIFFFVQDNIVHIIIAFSSILRRI